MKISQVAFETLVVVGVAILLVIIMLYYIYASKGDMEINKADMELDLFADKANKISNMESGNRQRARIEIPQGIVLINITENRVIFRMEDGNEFTDLHRRLKANITGFNFSEDGEPIPGVYDVIFESFDTGVCVYPPDKRQEYCSSLI